MSFYTSFLLKGNVTKAQFNEFHKMKAHVQSAPPGQEMEHDRHVEVLMSLSQSLFTPVSMGCF
jgi:hypothetical protein